MAGPWEKYQSASEGPWSKYQGASQPEREVVATTDDGGVVYRGADGNMSFASPSYSTSDPQRIAEIMKGAKPAEMVSSDFDKDAIAQAPIAARGIKAVEGVPFVGSYVDEAVDVLYGPRAAQGVRASSGAMERENPGQSTALQIGGGVAGAVPMALAAAPAVVARAAPTLGARAIQGGLAGAGIGAVEGAVYGAGDETDRLGSAQEGAIMGGVAGGALGAAGPLAAQGIKSALLKLRGTDINTISTQLGVSPAAAKVIKNALDRGDPDEAVRAMSAAGDDAMLADAGQAGRELLDAAANSGGQAGAIARGAVEDRVNTVSSEVQSVLDSTLGAPGGRETLKSGVRQTTANIREEAYSTAYSTPIDYSQPRGQALEQLLARVPQSAIKDANELMRLDGVTSAQIKAIIGEDGSVAFETLPDVRQLHYILQSLEGVASKQDGQGALGGTTPLGRATKGLSANIRNVLKGAVPEFAEAQDIAADAIQQVQAVDLGYSMLRPGTTREAVADGLRGASQAQKDQVKQGLRTYIDDTLANVAAVASDPNVDAREASKALQALSSRAARDKMRLVLGKDAQSLFEALDQASVTFQLRAAIAQNSKTAVRQSIQGSVREQTSPGFLENLASGEPVMAAKTLVQAITGNTAEAQAIREMGLFEEIAAALTQQKGRRAQRSLQVIQRAMRGQKIGERNAAMVANTLTTAGFLTASPQSGRQLTPQ